MMAISLATRLAIFVVAAAAITVACSSTGVVPGATAPPPSPTIRPTPTPTPTPAVVSAECLAEIGGFTDALLDLNSRLDVGLSFSAYSERVGDAKVAYDRIRVNRLDPGCLALAALGETAYNHYATAYNTWNDCVASTSCSNDSIRDDLQSEWADASDLLAQINDSLP